MPINALEIWEDSGAVVSGHGTTRQEVDNIGWKDSALDETYPFADYPVSRPYVSGDLFKVSYKKYNYFKISGTYDYAHQLKIRFVGDPEMVDALNEEGYASGVRIYYKWQSVYEVPDTDLLSGSWFDPLDPPDWVPLLSTVGPEGTANWVPVLAADTTYWTQYLVTQLYVEESVWDDYGNLDADFKIEMELTERKSGLPGYDPDLVNWSW